MARREIEINYKQQSGYDQLMPDTVATIVEINHNNNDLTADNVQDAIDELNIEKENKATFTTNTMLVANWSNKQYSFESTYPHAQFNIEISPANTITSEQLDVFNSAQILGNNLTNIVKAIGDVPTVDIPIIIKVVKK